MEEKIKVVVVTGSRSWKDEDYIRWVLRWLYNHHGSCLIRVGDCSGVDWLVYKWAKYEGHEREPYKAAWIKYGRAAGPIRNRLMFPKEGPPPDLTIAIHSDILNSKGTQDCIEASHDFGAPVLLFNGERREPERIFPPPEKRRVSSLEKKGGE